MPPFPHAAAAGARAGRESFGDFLAIDRIRARAQGLGALISWPALSPPLARRRASLRAERRGSKCCSASKTRKGAYASSTCANASSAAELFALVEPLRRCMAGLLGPRNGEVRMSLAITRNPTACRRRERRGLPASEARALCRSSSLAAPRHRRRLCRRRAGEPSRCAHIGRRAVSLRMARSCRRAGRGGGALSASREAWGRAIVADVRRLGTSRELEGRQSRHRHGARDALSRPAAANRAQRSLCRSSRSLPRPR
jgi:23S rRNA (uracil1939-C5)-methyltransferase